MKKSYERQDRFRLSCIAALLAGFQGVASAQQIPDERAEAVAAVAEVKSEVRLGAAYVSDDNRRFGQYSGLRDKGPYAIVDLDVVSLDKSTRTWTRFYGRNLGLDNREVLLDLQRQGDWRYFIGFSQTPRYEPFVVNTDLAGIGTMQQTIDGEAALRPVDLRMHRDQFSAGFDQAFGGIYGVRLRYTHEHKDGERIFGRYGGPPIQFLTEPLDRTTQTLELSLSRTGRDLQLSGGYYGTLFANHADRIDVDPFAFAPMSLPLSNDSHQLFVTGGYNVTPLTRASFKASYTVARQDENFIDVAPAATAPDAPKSLDGRVDTTIGYFDLTSVEIDRLDLQANLRYEDRDDKTPVARYQNAVTTTALGGPNANFAGTSGFNKPRSWSSLKGKLEAGYQLPQGFKVVGGVERDHQERSVPEPYRRVNFRAENDETTARVELKRSLFDSMIGSVAYSRARRTGSDYLSDTYADVNGAAAGTPTSSAVNPLLWADRERDAWRLSLDWSPLDELALHLSYDRAEDRYSGKPLGPREGERNFLSLDASYAISLRWQASLWASYDDTKAEQRTQVNPSLALNGGQYWQANLRNLGRAVGAGLRGKLKSGLELGADVSHYREASEHGMQALSAGDAVDSLPEFYVRTTEVRLFGRYPVAANAGVRLDYAFHDWRTNDWTWEGWQFPDGTTLTQDQVQRTHFVGASYYLRWR